MGSDADPDEVRLGRLAVELAEGIDAALGPWVVRSVERIVVAWSGSFSSELQTEADAAAIEARALVVPRVRTLLLTDIDEQGTTPLTLVRRAVPYPTAVLERAGVPPVVRDPFAERNFPDDRYGLAPATFADLDPDLHEPGLAWGAAKAFVFKKRRRAEGKR